jgi:uncharacterized protein DUF6925
MRARPGTISIAMEAENVAPRTSAASDAAGIFKLLAAQMADHETTWSLRTFGAIAEFTREPGEPVVLSQSDAGLAAVTGRGAIRIEPQPDMRLFASETATPESWNHRIALCLPERRCAMSGRTVLTVLGPDREALREQDRDAALFDLGIDALQVNACIRVNDRDLAAELASLAGRALFEPGNPALGIVLAANPHRVFVNRFGRIEVFQPIPAANGQSPEGPHTHVLPKLLAQRRTHAATEPIPTGWVPCAHLYPAHPAKDASGHRRPFDPARHDAFQRMLQDFGDAGLYALKLRVIAAVAAGADPSSVIASSGSRFMRTTVRVALRQLEAAGHASASLATGLAAHEPHDRS